MFDAYHDQGPGSHGQGHVTLENIALCSYDRPQKLARCILSNFLKTWKRSRHLSFKRPVLHVKQVGLLQQ